MMDSFSYFYGRSYRTNRASEIRLEENLRKKRSSTVQKPTAFKATPAPNCPEPVSRYAMKKKAREKKPKGRNAPFSGKGAKEKPTSVQIQKPKICQKQRTQTSPANNKIRGKTGNVKNKKVAKRKTTA